MEVAFLASFPWLLAEPGGVGGVWRNAGEGVGGLLVALSLHISS